ncbi:MAG: hypothetical protein ABJG14_02330 [Sulfitobacter sp.]|uniref:DUF1281 family ferredoxin-like fold protein n=1 Tax=Roseibium sp. TaxID=1936156 RepID=UPI003266405B
MPNYVYNRLYASEKVLDHLAGENGVVDFRTVLPFPDGLYEAQGKSGISFDAEVCAAKVCNEPCKEPLIAEMQQKLEDRSSVLKLDEDAFEDFVAMLRSKRRTGFFSLLDFRKEVWGTKWNACHPERSEDHVSFATAWDTPVPVLVALSKLFPDEDIHVEHVDDIYGDPGHVTLRNGEILDSVGIEGWLAPEEMNSAGGEDETDVEERAQAAL